MSEFIKQLFSSFRDEGTFLKLVHPNARFIGVRAETYRELALYGTFEGHAGARRFLAGLQATYDVRTFAIDASLENDTQGFATGRFEHRIRTNDVVLRSHWAAHCRFSGGLLLTYRFFEDTAATEHAFGIRTTSIETIDPDPVPDVSGSLPRG